MDFGTRNQVISYCRATPQCLRHRPWENRPASCAPFGFVVKLVMGISWKHWNQFSIYIIYIIYIYIYISHLCLYIYIYVIPMCICKCKYSNTQPKWGDPMQLKYFKCHPTPFISNISAANYEVWNCIWMNGNFFELPPVSAGARKGRERVAKGSRKGGVRAVLGTMILTRPWNFHHAMWIQKYKYMKLYK